MAALLWLALWMPGAHANFDRLRCEALLQPVRLFAPTFVGPYEMHPKFPQLGEHHEATVYYLHVKGLRIPIVMPSVRYERPDVSPLLFHLVGSMPYPFIQALAELRLNPEPFEPIQGPNGEWIDVVAFASSAMRSIDLSPLWLDLLRRDPTLAVHAFGHEFGHLMAYHLFGSERPSDAYVEAARRDGNHVSAYARAGGPVEDWAEAVGTYFRDPFGPSRALHPHRFAFLDGLFAR